MSAPAGASGPARVERLSGGVDRATLVVAGVAILGLIMAVLDTTIVNVALDTVSTDLHAPLSTIQWVTTGYLPVATAFGHTFMWAFAEALLAIVPAVALLRAERARGQSTFGDAEAGDAEAKVPRAEAA